MENWLTASMGNDVGVLKQHENMVGSVDGHNRTGLMLSTLKNAVDSVEYLAEKEYAEQEESGYTAMMIGATIKNIHAIKALCKTELKMQSNMGNTALMCAAVSDFTEAIDYLAGEAYMQNEYGQTALMLAAAYGNVGAVARLIPLEKGVCDKVGRTASMYAAESGQYECLKLLMLEEDQNTKDSEGNSVLFHALFALDYLYYISDYKTQEYFLDKAMKCIDAVYNGESQNDVNKKGQTILMMCAKNNLLDKVVDTASQHAKQQDTSGMSALMYACYNNASEAAKVLLLTEAGLTNNKGYTAAMLAAQNGSTDALNVVFSAERDIVDANKAGLLHYASIGGDHECVKILLHVFKASEDTNGQLPVHYAAKHNYLEALKLQLDPKLVTKPDRQGRTILHIAAASDSHDVVRYLVNTYYKYLCSLKDNSGKTAGQIAAENDAYRSFVLLVTKEGVNKAASQIFDCVESNAYKCLKVVCDVARAGQCAILCKDIEFSSKEQYVCYKLINSRNQNGYDAMIMATLMGHAESIRVLHYTFIDSNFNGITPLMFLAYKDVTYGMYSKDLLQLLSKYYGGRAIKESSSGVTMGVTALMLACYNNIDNIDLIKVLKEYEINNIDCNGKSAVDYAVAANRADVVKILRE